MEKTVFDKFSENRESLIHQFKKGDISKKEFIEEHYFFIQRLNLKPFKYGIDSFEKGLYNYQYYNMLAKYSYMKAKDVKLQRKHPKMVGKFLEETQYFYRQKNRATLKTLEYLEFKNMEAYYIKAKSPMLDNKLVEIILGDYEGIVLHSVSKSLVERLRDEGVFTEIKKRSIIDKYINEKY